MIITLLGIFGMGFIAGVIVTFYLLVERKKTVHLISIKDMPKIKPSKWHGLKMRAENGTETILTYTEN